MKGRRSMRTVAGLWVFAFLMGAVTSLERAARADPPAQQSPTAFSPPKPDDTTAMPVPTDLTVAHPGGITAEQVSQSAAATSWAAKANEETLRGAAARVDEAWAAFLP